MLFSKSSRMIYIDIDNSKDKTGTKIGNIFIEIYCCDLRIKFLMFVVVVGVPWKIIFLD